MSKNKDISEINGPGKRDNPRPAVSQAVVKRLPRYYRYLRELLREDKLRISSGELSRIMGVTSSQIRQDFNCFGGFGQQGYGYNVSYLYMKISEILGVTQNYTAVIIGAGNLGRALAGSAVFAKRGVCLVALFDIAPPLPGVRVHDYMVYGMDELDPFCLRNIVDIAVLTLPSEAAQETALRLARLGVKGIWNFTSTELNLDGYGTRVQNMHMGDSLMTLCYEMKVYNEE